MSLDLLPALRDGVIAAPGVIDELSQWRGEPAVFTRRPVPDDAADPMVVINPLSGVIFRDALASDNPVVTHDILIYGSKGAPGGPVDQTRAVERAAFAIREHFHRNRFSVQADGFHVVDVRVNGPFAAPVDDEATVGRVVSVTVALNRRLS